MGRWVFPYHELVLIPYRLTHQVSQGDLVGKGGGMRGCLPSPTGLLFHH